jgi:DUF4097 and DUF4098 domain-containing protein YvlB
MSKVFKIIGIILIISIVLMGGALIIAKGDISVFGEIGRESIRIDEENVVTSFIIDIAYDDIEFFASDDDKLHIDYFSSDNCPYVYSFIEGEAKLERKNNSGFDFSSIFNKNKDVKIYLPNTVTESLIIKCSAGEIVSKNVNIAVKEYEIFVSSGAIYIDSIISDNFNVEESSGEIEVNDCNSAVASIKCSSGSINVEDSNFENVEISVSNGDIELKNSELDTLDVSQSNGSLTASDIICTSLTCVNSCGSIDFGIKGKAADYTIEVDVELGDITLVSNSEDINMDTTHNLNYGTGENTITCRSSCGAVNISFS